jgi:hypothetical protein
MSKPVCPKCERVFLRSVTWVCLEISRFFLQMLAELHAQVGQYADGLTALDEALAEATKNESAFWTPAIRRCQARLILESNASRRDDAEQCLRAGLALAVEQGAKLHELGLYLDLAQLPLSSQSLVKALQKLRALYLSMNDGFEIAIYADVEQCLEHASAER